MKKILALLILMQILSRVAVAACPATSCPMIGEKIISVNSSDICYGSSARATCYQSGSVYYRVYDCRSCADGTIQATETASLDDCGTKSYTVCRAPCTADADFVSTGTTGYEKKTSCSSGGASSTQYRCAAGWYGASSDGATGCTQCPPNAESTATTTSPAGSALISACYTPAGNSFSDVAGAGTYSSNCGY